MSQPCNSRNPRHAFSAASFFLSHRALLAATWGLAAAAAQAQPYGLTSRPAIGPFLNNSLPASAPLVSGTWSAVVAFTNLVFTNAVGLAPVPGTNHLCVWEREGRIYSFPNAGNTTQKTLVLNISNQCQGWDDSGLLGVAFHPGFVTNRYLFVYYTWVTPGTVQGNANTRPPTFVTGAYHDRLSRFTLDANGVAIPGSEFVLIDQVGNSVWHNGGGMFFHPDNGFLYWTDGDDASGSNTQIINRNLFSGVFRIDVDQRGGAISHPIPRQPANGTTANYFIPNSNPFVGQPGVLEEFFCIGLRSPHRMTIDPPSGRIFIGDVGAGSREEISIIEPGESALNFQWDRIEGLNGDLTPPYLGINRRPVLDYPHSEGFAVIGGYVYRGSQFAADLGGKYIFGDNGSRVVWVMNETTTPATKVALCTVPLGSGPNAGNDYTGLSSFGLDANGEIYMCQMSSVGGRIYKLARSGPTGGQSPPALLSQTGAFTNLATLAPAPGLIPFEVNSPLWSDGAHKTRWLALPTNTFITFATNGEWSFPAGTVFVKNFDLSINETNPALRRRLETRLLARDTNGYVYGATYKWRPDLSDADIVLTSTNADITITTATGTRTQTWFYPGRQDCLRCHTRPAGGVLGVKTRQLNGDFTYAATGVTDNQIRAWNHVGLFSSPVSDAAIPGFTQLVPVTDTIATVEFRSRSYLDANCSHCHRPGGANARFDARIDTPLASQGLINGTALNALGIAGAKILVPGETNRSVLFLRDSALGAIQMPPLAKNVVDADAMAVLAQWINSLSFSNSPPPVVSLTSPTNGSSFVFGTPILLAAKVTKTNGTVANVEFFRDNAKLGEDAVAPYTFDWSNAPLGTFTLRAVAADNLGQSSTSAPANVTITAPAGTNAWMVKVNFQAASAPSVPIGYLADYGAAFGDRGNGFAYGWDIDNTVNARYRNSVNSPDLRYDTLNHMQKPGGATNWEIALPNGPFNVRLVSGDPDNFDGTYRIALEGALFLDAQPSTATRFFEQTGTATITDGRLTLGNYAGSVNNKVNFIEITSLAAPVPPIVLHAETALTNRLRLWFDAATGVTYVVEASTNLFHWSPVTTNGPGTNRVEYSDPNAIISPQRYFRARGQ